VLAWILGWLWWTVLPVRKRLAVASYRRCFPERDPGELRRTVGELGAGYRDLLLGRRMKVEGAELLAGGGLVLCGHGSAWDMALVSLGEATPVTIFVKAPSNKLAAWWIERVRRRSGVELLPPDGSMQDAYEALARGRTVMFVQDQRRNQGLAVPFFGRPALTSPALAAAAWRTRAPLFGFWQWKEGGSYRARIECLDWPVPEDREQAIAELTARSQRFYEERIHTAPHSWLWLHDRWKRAPETCVDPLAGPAEAPLAGAERPGTEPAR